MVNSAQSNIDRYGQLMSEVKLRLRSLEADAVQIQSFWPTLENEQVFVFERACLQLRKILEAIVFASMVANKDQLALAHPNFAEFWRANKIMGKLREINQYFYPVPVTETRVNGKLQHLEEIQGDHWLSEAECSELIDLCGDMLHIANPFAPRDPASLNRPLLDWIVRIRALLNVHTVLLTEDQVIAVRMGDWSDSRVEVLKLGAY